MKKWLTSGCLLLCLFACKDEEGPAAFILTVDPSYATDETNDWVMLHDAAGNLLDFAKFESGQTFRSTAAKSMAADKISITFFRDDQGSSHYRLKSYLGISPGQKWTLKPAPVPDYPHHDLSAPNFRVTDVYDASVTSALVTNQFGRTADLTKESGTDYNIDGGFSVSDKGSIYLISVETTSERPKYKWATGLETSYFDFEPFDDYLHVSFPECNSYLQVTAYKNGQPLNGLGYVLYNNDAYRRLTRSSHDIGYLNKFTRYTTELHINDGKYDLTYNKWGDKATAINFPTGLEFSLQNTTLSKFAFSSNTPFVKRFSTYVGYVDRVLLYWEIYAGSDAEKIVEWPESFSSEYSMIDPQEIFHMQSEFFLSGPSLIDMIDETFGGKTKNEDFESYSVTLQ